jgi:hypothetical protein
MVLHCNKLETQAITEKTSKENIMMKEEKVL